MNDLHLYVFGVAVIIMALAMTVFRPKRGKISVEQQLKTEYMRGFKDGLNTMDAMSAPVPAPHFQPNMPIAMPPTPAYSDDVSGED